MPSDLPRPVRAAAGFAFHGAPHMTADNVIQFVPRIRSVPTLVETEEAKAAEFLCGAPALIGDAFTDTAPAEMNPEETE